MSQDNFTDSQGKIGWINPYIPGILTKPNYIVPCQNGLPTNEEIQFVRNRISLFNNTYCEIGSGSGEHLIEQARREPSALFIGFEVRYKRAFRTAEKSEQIGQNNLLIIKADGRLISRFFNEDELSGVFINFPDPWAKKRWVKHRILNDGYIKLLLQLLKHTGFLSFKTDDSGYYQSVSKIIRGISEYKISKSSEDLHLSPYKSSNILTEFERLFISKRQPIFMLEALKGNKFPVLANSDV